MAIEDDTEEYCDLCGEPLDTTNPEAYIRNSLGIFCPEGAECRKREHLSEEE